MTISPISYPVRLPQNDYVNCDGNYRFTSASISKNDEQKSIFSTINGNKVDKQVAFGEYEQKIAAQNNLVKRHEEAHLAFSGSQASGSPVYETKTDKDGRVIITGGHQAVNIPEAVDKKAPLVLINQTINAAKLALKGALAPQSFDELSSADKQVAAKSAQILAGAETAQSDRLLFQPKADTEKHGQIKAQERQNNPNQQKQTASGQKLNLIG
ncbi:MAG: hypothetical protein A2039_07385 [Candidatus Melainabacteria bacterium GWA2_34_9]|nr:MAG: hypothetical protein A2039_07385 [Candidatus Melainabacteria bacterium GWA2_34_9]